MELSERAKQFKISGIRVLFNKAEQYENTINFGIGEPGFRPPQNVVDKTAWATVVRSQQLPWINVCDTRGNQSPLLVQYGLTELPTAYFLVDGDMDPNASISDAASMRKYLQSKL